MPGDVQIAGFCVDPLVVPVLILRGSAWKNAMGAINKCVASFDGAHGKRRATALNGIRSRRSPGNAPGNSPWSPWHSSKAILHGTHAIFPRK